MYSWKGCNIWSQLETLGRIHDLSKINNLRDSKTNNTFNYTNLGPNWKPIAFQVDTFSQLQQCPLVAGTRS